MSLGHLTVLRLAAFNWDPFRALCRTKLLPVTHVLEDTWMLTVKPVYKLFNVSDDLNWTTNTNTHDTIYTHF